MFKTIKRLIRRRKAVSPVISAILLIALVVISVSAVYFLILPYMNKVSLYASIYRVSDTNKDSRYEKITLFLSNAGTNAVEINEVSVWTATDETIGDQDTWLKHEEWIFSRTSGNIVHPSIFKEETLTSNNQLELTIETTTYYRLEIYFSGNDNPYISSWEALDDQVDFSDLVEDFEKFDLQAWGMTGTIDVPGWPSNNYQTYGGPEYGPIISGQNVWLPVIGETKLVQFFFTGKIVVFHSVNNGNITGQPLIQQINRTEAPFKAQKLFVLGLAGSWGDEFPNGATAITLNVTYTDGTSSIWQLGHDYIDDWWYTSNNPKKCISAPYGKITEIDLGYQVDYPYQHIHTHTASFQLNYYKYVQFVSFIDPGNDNSGAHLLSISAG
ncbi:MAG TPA: type IV pilin [Candidatus Bathyarchaeia archaeon]|nr:type IV pilin [Candidatus Bathyarchaeia archaeon]